MTSGQVLALVLGLLVLIVAGVLIALWLRHKALRNRFGPEYEQVVADQDSRLAAERELIGRERRHSKLELRELDPAARERYAQQWRAVQGQFVENPARAVVAGDELVTNLVAERGYPTKDYEEQLSYLSVEHARTLTHYRDAHEIYLRGQRGDASTEDLRQALVHYRALFADLLGADPVRAPQSEPDRGRVRASGAGEPADAGQEQADVDYARRTRRF